MNDNIVKILFTGDFCPINRIENLALEGNFMEVFNDFIDVLQDNDLNITDLECPLTEAISARLKTGPHQKAHPECIKLLQYANFGIVTLANNHIMDYGTRGIINTLDICKANYIDCIGVGQSPKDAGAPFSTTIRGKNIAILNFADDEFITAPYSQYRCNPINPVNMLYDLKAARDKHDYVIVVIHAGNEHYELPSLRIRKLYRFIIDLGADAVISHHTHAFSGYELYKSKPIFYGLGNFIYDWPGNTNMKWNSGYVVKLLISDKIDFEIIPLKQINERPGIFHLDADETKTFFMEIDRLNRIINDDKKIEVEFQNYCDLVFPMYDAFIEPNFGKYVAYLRKRGIWPRFLSKRKRLLLLNLIRCESHREVLIKMLCEYNVDK